MSGWARIGDLGFKPLVRALLSWLVLFVFITIIENMIMGNAEAADQLIKYVETDPLGAARSVSRLLAAMLHPGEAMLGVGIYGLSIGLLMDALLITLFLLTLLAGVQLWLGFRSFRGRGFTGLALFVGSTISLIGASLALLGVLSLMFLTINPVVEQGMTINVSGPIIYLTIPLPWPITVGVAAWVMGIAIIGAALMRVLSRGQDVIGAIASAMLILGAILAIIPLIGFAIMSVSAMMLGTRVVET
ncbi:MAG: hypothetical protein ACP5NY_06940 [Thermocladium sp.]